MSFLGSDILEQVLKDKVEPFYADNIIHSAYELSLGKEYYVTDSSKKSFLTDTDTQIEINPGQFALLETEETIEIPPEYIGFISIKFGLKRRGIINVSGFHVDPGFKGKLTFSVYNAGSKSINLEKGDKYFQLWLSHIEDHSKLYKGSTKGITPNYVNDIKGQPISLHELDEKIKELGHLKRRNQWLLTFLIVLVAGLFSKLFWNWDQYSQGYVDGYDNKVNELVIKETVKSYLIDKNILLKDTTLSKKPVNDDEK